MRRILKSKHLLKFLVFTLIILVTIDILTGLWYFNRNLEFDSTKFNNIATPIVTLVSFLALFYSLSISLEQNQINLADNLKPYFENEKDKIITNIKKLTQNDYGMKTKIYETNYDGFNYAKGIRDSILKLVIDGDYIADINKLENLSVNEAFTLIRERSYGESLIYLNNWGIGAVYFPFNNIKKLLNEILSSKMHIEAKRSLYLQIKDEILFDYIDLMLFDKNIIISPTIPILFTGQQVEFKKFHETRFGDLFRWIEENVPFILS